MSMSVEYIEEHLVEWEQEYRAISAEWGGRHQRGCICPWCELDYLRSVWDGMRNHRGEADRWEIGDQTGKMACAAAFADRESRAHRPICDFHGLSVAAREHPHHELAWALAAFDRGMEREHRLQPGVRPSIPRSPKSMLMWIARLRWDRTHTAPWAEAEPQLEHSLIMLELGWVHGIAMEEPVRRAAEDAIKNQCGPLWAALATWGVRAAHVQMAPSYLEREDIDLQIVPDDARHEAAGIYNISVKTGHAFSPQIIAKQRKYKGGRAILYIGTPDFWDPDICGATLRCKYANGEDVRL